MPESCPHQALDMVYDPKSKEYVFRCRRLECHALFDSIHDALMGRPRAA